MSPEFFTGHCFFEFVLRYDLQQLVKLAAVFAVYAVVGHIVMVGAQINPCAVLLAVLPPSGAFVDVMAVEVVRCSAHPTLLFVAYN